MNLPPDHPLRSEVNEEVHARPSDPLTAPLRISYLALLYAPEQRAQEWIEAAALIERYGFAPPAKTASHFSADLGPFHVRWERHTEFVRYTFTVQSVPADPFAVPALAAVPREWIESLSGKIMVAAHAALLNTDEDSLDFDAIAARHFAGNVVVGGAIADGAAIALTDFRIHADGFSRLLIHDHGMSPRQAGRMVQRLLELDTYRIMALLALPVARELGPFLAAGEKELADVTSSLTSASVSDEPALLERLTRLEAAIGSRESSSHYRFSAAAAYYELVQRRIQELRERRIQGLQTFQEFTERRLAPAMNTCRAVASRQRSLSERVARANQLLSTRVEIDRQRQNQSLLESMNRRAEAQLRLQQTVEGLSVAAVTYYVVGIIGYAAKGLVALGLPFHTDVVIGVSIPVVAVLVALGIRRIRKSVTHPSGQSVRD
jgi:uncharacterized membrane-anchored protein